MIISLILTALYCLLTYILFYRQCIVYLGMYNSDMLSYIATINGEATEYSFPYPLMFKCSEWISHLCPTEIALSIVVTLLNGLSLWLLIYYLKPFVRNIIPQKKEYFKNLMAGLLALSLLFVSMLFIPANPTIFGHAFTRRCVGVFSPNPYWNATYLATRPFTIINFFSACKMLDSYESDAKLKDYLIFAVSLLLTTLTKPSYTLVAVVLFIVIFIFRLIKSKGKNIKKTILFGLAFLPAGLDCIYQYMGVFTGTNTYGEETGIGIEFGKAWYTATDSIFFSVLLGGAFALFMLITNIRRLKDTTWFRYSWQLYLTGIGMFLFLYEKGFRLFHCNFAWGYVHAMFFVFMTGLILLIKNTKEAKTFGRKLSTTLGWLLYSGHLLCGIKFFMYLFNGGDFFKY